MCSVAATASYICTEGSTGAIDTYERAEIGASFFGRLLPPDWRADALGKFKAGGFGGIPF